jgi:hypothetical protein
MEVAPKAAKVKMEKPRGKRVRIESAELSDGGDSVVEVEAGPSIKKTAGKGGKGKEKAEESEDKVFWLEEVDRCRARLRVAQSQLDHAVKMMNNAE